MSIKSEDKFYQTFIINGVIFNEMNDYHLGKERKLEDDKQANDFMLMRVLWWKDRVKKEVRTISLNPTRNIARTRINNLKKFKDCTPILMDNIIDFIKNTFENTLNLGHTDAYSYLCNIDEPILVDDFITPKPLKTFEFTGDLNHFHKQCVKYKVIDCETSLDSFKMAFGGSETYEINFIDFICPNTTFICLITLLNDNDLLNNYPSNFHKVAEKISGKKNLKVSLSSWKKFGTFKMEEEINELIKSLK